jgi:hypothetical protein
MPHEAIHYQELSTTIDGGATGGGPLKLKSELLPKG